MIRYIDNGYHSKRGRVRAKVVFGMLHVEVGAVVFRHHVAYSVLVFVYLPSSFIYFREMINDRRRN